VRQRLRVFTTTWLAFQLVWLAGLVPRDCCAAHPPAEKSCHDAAPATHCPMRGADGRPCPMHRGQAEQPVHDHGSPAAHHDETPSAPPTDCRLSGACDGPMSALLALLSHHGILPESGSAVPPVDSHTVSAAPSESFVGRFAPPDPPPPRA
jgi:hypothetical protein